MPQAANADDQQQQQQRGDSLPPQQQQQQPQGPAVPGTPSSTAATPAAPEQQQQQQEQYTPGGFLSLPELAAGLGDVTMAAATNSTGSLDALMGCEATPQGEDLADSSEQQQQGVSGGLGGVEHKRQRLAGLETGDSPLVFRPTPQKQ
jgi:hypothetical protein